MSVESNFEALLGAIEHIKDEIECLNGKAQEVDERDTQIEEFMEVFEIMVEQNKQIIGCLDRLNERLIRK